ncbi:MAG TPA: valine--tRNA ligase [Armatimonadota bacterium]|nr:valine--tRNA ligase [Armatimonadota bacterium]
MTANQDIALSGELARQYEPGAIEAALYERWMERGYFHAEVDRDRAPYCITIPPPNVTGELHMGHGLCYTIHDVLVRWKRMQGLATLCLPGTDHAGIATQNVVERMLAEKEGLSRHDLGREAFVQRVWEWKEKYGSTIIEQMKSLGCSFDWERERFTMDAAYSEAVLEAFIHLFNEGYIYRGYRVSHWCPRCRTAISDIEVDDEEQAGSLWYFKYPIEDGYMFGTEHIVIATTRPETMLGDTAVAVHPEDPRYQSLIGRHVVLPIMGRRIPIIADPILVDPEFGTGALKVTPAHDFNDFDAGERNDLPKITVIGPDARMTEEAGPFAGMDRMDARAAVVERMNNDGLLVKIEDHTIVAPICDRCKTVLEPLLSEQWYCRMSELAAPAIGVVREKQIQFTPDRWEKVYLDWMERLRDWCISRQLWWGHRIPIYYCDSCGKVTAARRPPERCAACEGISFTQDPDVLDTWFSSSLWPFATLGWPQRTPELDYFYPTSALITASEIIYLWVARMIFMGMEFMKDIPYPDVYIYATVLDANGERMSKSKGNGINPVLLVSQYGADATRYAIVTQAGKAQQIRFVLEKQCPECKDWSLIDAERCRCGQPFPEEVEWRAPQVAQARLFCNKIWQASRFVMMNLGEDEGPRTEDESQTLRLQAPLLEAGRGRARGPGGAETEDEGPGTEDESQTLRLQAPLPASGRGRERGLEDRWIFSRLANVTQSVNEGLAAYDLDVATRSLHEFVWSEFCDWYIELAKRRLSGGDPTIRENLRVILDTILRLLHPFMPFLSEAIWQRLPEHGATLMLAGFPEVNLEQTDLDSEQKMEQLMDLVVKIRNMRSELKVAPGLRIPVFLSNVAENLTGWMEIVENRARCNIEFETNPQEGDSRGSAVSASGSIAIRIPLEGLVDFEKERARLSGEIASLEKEIEGLDRQLSNDQFLTRAPENVVSEKRRRRAELEERLRMAAEALQRSGT